MKTVKHIFIISISALVLSSCANKEGSIEDVIKTNDLELIRAKKVELGQQKSALTGKLDQLDEAIKRLDPNKGLPLVTTMVINDTLFNHYTEVQGDVATKENIVIFPEYSGVLTKVYVKEGQKVSKGAILAKIDDGGLSSQLAQLESRSALAKTTYERQKRLWDQNIGSEIQYLEAKTSYDAAENAVNQMKSQLGKTTVRAPFSGVIDEVISEQGEVVNPGQNQLFRLVNLDNMYIQASVPENYLSQIKVGTTVKVQIAAINKEYDAKVRQVGNFINPTNRTFQIEVAIPNDGGQVKPNLIATVKLNDYTAENVIIIPENTVQKNSAGESIVYTLDKKNDSIGTAKRKIIETGYTSNESIEVVSGLESGSELILEGGRNLRDGQEVKIKN